MLPFGKGLCCEREDVWEYAADAARTRSAIAAVVMTRFIENLSACGDRGRVSAPVSNYGPNYGVTVKGTSRVTDWLFVLSVIFICTL